MKNFTRIIREIFDSFPVKMPLVIFLILFCAGINTLPSVFIQKITALIEFAPPSLTWPEISMNIIKLLLILAGLYALSLAGVFFQGYIGAEITQGVLLNIRQKMFDRMQNLPVKFFDSQSHGDIMSKFVNDVESMRQLISQAAPNLLTAIITIIAVISIMLYFSIWLTCITFMGIIIMFIITKKIGGRSSHHFRRQHKNTGLLEGFAEEMMTGQKVIKVFCREDKSIQEFEKINNELFTQSEQANKRANTLGPILNNIGNILYVITALSGGALILANIKNFSISGLPMSISVVLPFLNMTKQFAMTVNHLSMNINSVISGLAGAGRIFELIDSEPEDDSGKIILDSRKTLGDIEFCDINFAYNNNVKILHDITLSAKPGQKIAIVGSTGAGKTTIANLIPRFYDVQSGKILLDGVDIREIKKSSLRKNLAVVLQDTNLFSDSILENIRYGNLSASDQECINAAKLVGADDFITRLPEGYNTFLTGAGANLSHGQRQLIAISRAAAANPAIMILDEATSSIDTRTESLVQRGMDALMHGRTVFVIAHRLSTVRNSDLILVIEHGQIIERGTHSELLAKKGRYYNLYTGKFELS